MGTVVLISMQEHSRTGLMQHHTLRGGEEEFDLVVKGPYRMPHCKLRLYCFDHKFIR